MDLTHAPHRRRFLAGACTLGAASLLRIDSHAATDRQAEVSAVRFASWPTICTAPQYVAEPLLHAEGISEVKYVDGLYQPGEAAVGPAKADFDMDTPEMPLRYADQGIPIVALAGIHLGCYELFAHPPVRTIRDLKGRRIGVDGLFGSKRLLLSSMAAFVGMDPNRDIEWLDVPSADAMRLFAEGKVDAFLGYPPEPQQLRARKIGQVIVNTATDKPWSQYFCCILYSHRDFVRAYPATTKRVTRALLKAADLCAESPALAARQIVSRKFVQSHEMALESLHDVHYDAWRTYDPADTLRFYALRLRETGMVKSTPQKLLEQATDWRFLNEVKKELKA